MAEFLDDVTSLAELQARLAAIDLRDAARESAVPMVVTFVGLVLLVSGAPVALLGASSLLASALKIDPGWGMLLTAGAAIALGTLLALFSGRQLRHGLGRFQRSRKQLGLNLAWVRAVLVTTARSRSMRRRRS